MTVLGIVAGSFLVNVATTTNLYLIIKYCLTQHVANGFFCSVLQVRGTFSRLLLQAIY